MNDVAKLRSALELLYAWATDSRPVNFDELESEVQAALELDPSSVCWYRASVVAAMLKRKQSGIERDCERGKIQPAKKTESGWVVGLEWVGPEYVRRLNNRGRSTGGTGRS